ncbi:acyltransferase family protein [uncultured Thiothrix sp.]|uniref:acyltransferase family protein n=1 Tax=uncultured Thiothrix sp. TaxID=223185 RepID=UPI00262F7BBA|nr:acyltransferase family protein [uncultured Thiothrix sp.]HMT93191.1 acyltransferase family protein [Thiolinea sp.]
MNYRPEIDGLRALAVVAVILFHMNFNLFQGGFLGVDLFFVISGYLITNLILNELKFNDFSLVGFYERRARRILPALLVVLLATYAFSWFFMLPDAHRAIGQYVVGSLTFSSNLLFYIQNKNYFKLGEEENPLLHTWSLAVEEQYYILFPLLLLLLWPNRRILLVVLVTIGMASILTANWLLAQQALAAFYLLPARIWELLAGALAAIYLSSQLIQFKPIHHWLGLLGLGLMVLPIFLFNAHTPVPSFYTLIPVLGCVLVIIFAQKGAWVQRFLSQRWIVGLGLISYSVYLWHQPILVYTQLMLGSLSTVTKLGILFPIMLVFAYLTWLLVEQPFRNKQQVSLKQLVAWVAPASLMLISLGVLGQFTNGFEMRSPLFQRLASNAGFGKQCNGNFQYQAACASSQMPAVATLGNSYMVHFSKNLTEQYATAGVLQLTKEGCEIGLIEKDVALHQNTCVDFYKKALQTIESLASIKLVIMSSPFNGVLDEDYYASLRSIIDNLNEQGLPVLLLGPTPDAPFNVGRCLVKQYYLPWLATSNTSCNFEVSAQQLKKVAKLQELAQQTKAAKFIDLTETICSNYQCQMLRENGILMYTDQGHLSVEASSYVLNQLKHELPKL